MLLFVLFSVQLIRSILRWHHISATSNRLSSYFCKVHHFAPYVMTDHISALTNSILSYFRIPLSFQIVCSSMVAFLALPILALMSSEQLPVLVLMAPRYLKEFTLSIVSPSTSIDTFAFSSHTTISLGFWAFNFSNLIFPASFTLCTNF